MKCVDSKDVKSESVEFNSQIVKDVTISWLLKKEDGAPNFAMRMFEMKPDSQIPTHKHPWEHEIFILEGEGEIIAGDTAKKVYPNTAVFIEPNIDHSYKNTGSQTLKFLCIIPHS